MLRLPVGYVKRECSFASLLKININQNKSILIHHSDLEEGKIRNQRLDCLRNILHVDPGIPH